MRINIALLFLFLLFPLTVGAEEISKLKLQSQGKQRTYYLYVPDTAKASATPVPLIVLFHGSDRNGQSLIDEWRYLAGKEGFILVGPDSSGAGWRTPEDGPEFIHELVETLIKKYKIDTRRIYMFGHSAGAVFALDLAMLESEYYAAVAVHAGAWRSSRELSFAEQAKRKIPVKIFIGDRDMFFPLSSVRDTEGALKDHLIPIDVVIMKGHTHWYYDVADEINKNAWDFLKQASLTGERRHAEYNSNNAASDANAVLKQVNMLRLEADGLTKKFYAQEEELNAKDRVRDKVRVEEIVREQVKVLVECAAALKNAAAAADDGSKLKLASKHQQYFVLISAASLKRAEAVELIRMRAELLLKGEEPNVINPKRDELVNKANALNDEAAALEKKAEQLMG